MKFMEEETVNPTFTQNQIAEEFDCSDSTSTRYRNDKGMGSPYNRKTKRRRTPNYLY